MLISHWSKKYRHIDPRNIVYKIDSRYPKAMTLRDKLTTRLKLKPPISALVPVFQYFSPRQGLHGLRRTVGSAELLVASAEWHEAVGVLSFNLLALTSHKHALEEPVTLHVVSILRNSYTSQNSHYSLIMLGWLLVRPIPISTSRSSDSSRLIFG